MEQHKCIGIYISGEIATIAVVGKGAGKGFEVSRAFCVNLPGGDEESGHEFSYHRLAEEIAKQCSACNIAFYDSAVALDCTMYRQQRLHSEFTDVRQIAQTVAFDAEEALAVDAAETAIAFEVIGRGVTGSEVSVFAMQSRVVSDIIVGLQNNKLDPVTVEPDSACLRRFIRRNLDGDDHSLMWCVISDRNCYLIHSGIGDGKEVVRTFITGRGQNKTELLAREVIMTKSSVKAAEEVESLKVIDFTDEINFASLSEKIGFEALKVDVPADKIGAHDDPEHSGQMGMVIAAGAAIGQLAKAEKIDFRPGFMPYQGKKEKLAGALKILSGALIVLFVAFGVYLQMQYFQASGYLGRLEDKFSSEFSIAVPGGRFRGIKDPVGKLKREINRIKDVKSGLLSAAGEDSIEAKLTFLFEALNSVPKNVDLDISKISVTTKTMSITGNTSSRGYLSLFSSIDKHAKLARGQSSYQSKDGRDYFSLTIEIK